MVLCSSCGPAHVRMPQEVRVDYEAFVAIIGQERLTSGRILFEEDEAFSKDMIGLCNNPGVGDWTVYIKWSWWADNPLDRKALLFHELTHCILKYSRHSPDRNSYMFKSLRNPADLEAQVAQFL